MAPTRADHWENASNIGSDSDLLQKGYALSWFGKESAPWIKVNTFKLVPEGFVVEYCAIDGECVTVGVSSAAEGCVCRAAGQFPVVHGACSGGKWPISNWQRCVDLLVMVRRFWCDAVLCGRRIFAERFVPGWSRAAINLLNSRGGQAHFADIDQVQADSFG